MSCEFCHGSLPSRTGAGRPSVYCGVDCRRGAEALAILARVLPERPAALVRVLEALEGIAIPVQELGDTDTRRVRAAAFTLASRRHLVPGSSGRYTRRNRNDG